MNANTVRPTSGRTWTDLQVNRTVLAAAGDHSILGPFNVTATLSLAVLLAGAVALAAHSPRLPDTFTVPTWLLRIPVELAVLVVLVGLTGLVLSYALLY